MLGVENEKVVKIYIKNFNKHYDFNIIKCYCLKERFYENKYDRFDVKNITDAT